VTGLPFLLIYAVAGPHVVIMRVLHASRRWP
jgi:plasmid stabilization system protein ParE